MREDGKKKSEWLLNTLIFKKFQVWEIRTQLAARFRPFVCIFKGKLEMTFIRFTT